ncbi:MAG TPA: efflux RND transporter periplasmic adaptor subunit [Thalassobaculum sp.]
MIALAACDQLAPASTVQPPPPAVTVVKAEQVEVVPSSSFTGRIEAVDKVVLRARVPGFIEQQLFKEGAEVTAGDLMYAIESATYLAQIDEINASIARAEATLKLANIDTQRQRELVSRQVKAQSTLDESVAKEAESRADLLKQQAALRRAELDLGYTEIRAPIAGRVGRAAYSVGDFVEPSSGALATIVSQDPIYVTFPVSQRDLLEVRRGIMARGADPRAISVKVRLADGSVYDGTGSLNFVDVEVEAATDTVTLRAQLPNPDRMLIDGQLVTAIVEAAIPQTALLIPTEALQIDQAGRFALVVDAENKVQVRRIEIGRAYDGRMSVSKGLEAGERVVTVGSQKVRPSQVVKPVEAPAQAARS